MNLPVLKRDAPQREKPGRASGTLAKKLLRKRVLLPAAACVLAGAFALRSRRLPLRWRCILRPGKPILHSFIRYSAPVVCNEAMWSVGASMLTVIMGHMANSQDMLAAYALIGNIDKLSTVVCFGIAAASAVIIGKEIGMGRDRERVYSVGWTLLVVSLLVGALVMLLLLALLPLFFRPVLFRLFKLTAGAAEVAGYLAVVYAVFMPMRAFDVTNITGVLRAGGDGKMASIIDITPLWLVAIPLMAVAALVLQAPTWVVCISMQAENICKCPIGLVRFHSRRWINDITRMVE